MTWCIKIAENYILATPHYAVFIVASFYSIYHLLEVILTLSNSPKESIYEKILSITALCLLSTSVFAQSAQTGLVIGAAAGAASTASYDSSGIASNITKIEGGPISSVIIGYDLALNQHISLGLESGFGYGYDLASLKADGSDKSMLNQWYIPLLVAGKYTFTNGVNVFVKGGATYVHQQGCLFRT